MRGLISQCLLRGVPLGKRAASKYEAPRQEAAASRDQSAESIPASHYRPEVGNKQELAIEMLDELGATDPGDGDLIEADRCSLEGWPPEGLPFWNIVAEYLQRARALDPAWDQISTSGAAGTA